MKVLLVSHQFPMPHIPYRGRFVEDQVLATRQAGVDFFVLQVEPAGLRIGNVTNFFAALWFGLILGRETPIYIEGRVAGSRLYSPGIRLGGGIQSVVNAMAVVRWMMGKDLNSYDCIHAHTGLSDGLIALVLSRLLGRKPFIVTEHTGPYEMLFRGFGGRWIAGLVARRANSVIAVSTFLRDCIKRYFPEVKVDVVGNTYDAKIFEPTDRSSAADSPTVLWIGHISSGKRLRLGILALAKLRLLGVDASLKVLTSSNLESEIESLIAQHSLVEHVSLVCAETRERVSSELKKGAALLVTSELETFSVTTLESLATGVPVVSTNCGGPADLLSEQEDGVLDIVGSAESLAQSLKKVIETDTMGARASRARRAREKFGPDSIGHRYLAIYREITKSQ